jgi:hypothetical protein
MNSVWYSSQMWNHLNLLFISHVAEEDDDCVIAEQVVSTCNMVSHLYGGYRPVLSDACHRHQACFICVSPPFWPYIHPPPPPSRSRYEIDQDDRVWEIKALDAKSRRKTSEWCSGSRHFVCCTVAVGECRSIISGAWGLLDVHHWDWSCQFAVASRPFLYSPFFTVHLFVQVMARDPLSLIRWTR